MVTYFAQGTGFDWPVLQGEGAGHAEVRVLPGLAAAGKCKLDCFVFMFYIFLLPL